MNENARVRESVATIVVTLVDAYRNGSDVDLITAGLLEEFEALLETHERAALALLAFAKLSADALAYSAEDLVPARTEARRASDARDAEPCDIAQQTADEATARLLLDRLYGEKPDGADVLQAFGPVRPSRR